MVVVVVLVVVLQVVTGGRHGSVVPGAPAATPDPPAPSATPAAAAMNIAIVQTPLTFHLIVIRVAYAQARRNGGPQAQTQAPATTIYIESGALTPSSSSDSAITRCEATDSAIRNDSSCAGETPTTLLSR